MTREKKAKIQKYWVQETVELLQDKKFALSTFKLDWQHAPPLAPKVVDTVDLRYGRLFLYAKTKFHANQLKMEIAYLKILTLQGCRRINKMKQELKYIQSLEIA